MKLPETRIVEEVKNNGTKEYTPQFKMKFLFFHEWTYFPDFTGRAAHLEYKSLEWAKLMIDILIEENIKSMKEADAEKVVQTNYIKYP